MGDGASIVDNSRYDALLVKQITITDTQPDLNNHALITEEQKYTDINPVELTTKSLLM